jgi:hypothetical protein
MPRENKIGGVCDVCADANNVGQFWHTTAEPLDIAAEVAALGITTELELTPIESDTSEPERCDRCEELTRELSLRATRGKLKRVEELLRRRLASEDKGREGT